MTIEKLTDQQYADLMAVIDGHTPNNALGLQNEGLIEPITQINLQDGIRYRLTGEGRRYYTSYREHQAATSAHLE